jgi:hypothetical protein
MEERGGIEALAAVVAAVPKLSAALEDVHTAAPALRRWLLPPAWVRRVETMGAFTTADYILFRTGLIGGLVQAESSCDPQLMKAPGDPTLEPLK